MDLKISFNYLQMMSGVGDTYNLSFYRGVKSNKRHHETGRQNTTTKPVSAPTYHQAPVSVLWSIFIVTSAVALVKLFF